MTLVRASGPIRVYLFLICLAAVSGLFLWASPARAGGPDDDPSIDFTTLSLEELKGVEITSASRTPERLSEIPAAVFVITSEDIRRSGATSIPDVLRMAPGVQVARISATEWAVNVRGLNEQYSNNLLVLVDGRSAYTHVLSGVFWDTVDTILEDIERIEIIRGPGAALWGVNAVNGVINIITKNARKTQGHEVTALVGTQESISTARYGGIFGKGGYYRIYAKGFYRGSLFENDRNIFDDPSRSNWRSGRGGFRMDMNPNSGEDALTVEGEAYAGQVDVRTGTPSLYEPWFSEEDETDRSSGGHILSRWQHRFSDTSDTVWRLYYDYYNRDFDGGSVCVNTLDLDFQHSFALAEIHELTWGLNGRLVSDSFQDNFSVSAWPSGDEQLFYSAFFQDKVPLLPKHLWLTLGAKFERSSEAGTEIQPSMRLLWTPVQGHSLWAAVSRAARVPSRIEKDGVKNEFVYAPGTYAEDVPTVVRTRGSDSLVPEQLIAYELGYGFQPAENMWLNIAGFYNNYEDLIGLRLNRSVTSEDDPVPHDLVLFEYDNNSSGQSFGMEVSAYWQPARFWRLQGAYTFLETRLRQEVTGADPDMENILSQASNPRNQISIRSSLDLTEQLEFDAWLRYVDRLSENRVDDYLSMDLRLAWNVTPLLELSVTGQDLLESRHAEFSSLEIRRSVYVKMDWSF